MVNLIILLMMIILPERTTSCKPSQEAVYYKTSLRNLEIQMQGLEDKLDYLVANQEEPEVSKKNKGAEHDVKPEQDDKAVVEENPGSDY